MINRLTYLSMLVLLNLTPVSDVGAETKNITSKPFVIGESLTWTSQVLNQQRTINVFLPASYRQGDQSYPVIYLLDGSADEDFIHIAGLVQFGSFSWINMLDESIVVGIANVDRKHDMTYPTQNKQDLKDFPTTGGSADFINFIKTELQPLVKRTYRSTDETTLIGQSLGGLLATEILFKQAELFDQYLIVSPSLWWDGGSLLKLNTPDLKNHKVFIGVGKEGPIMQQAAKDLFQKLTNQPQNQTTVRFQYFENLDHGDTLHQAAYAGFEFLFNKQP